MLVTKKQYIIGKRVPAKKKMQVLNTRYIGKDCNIWAFATNVSLT